MDALSDLARGRPRKATKLLIQGANAVRALTAKTAASHQNKKTKPEQSGGEPDQDNVLTPTFADPSLTAVPDEAEALRRTLPQLMRLDRYEQRAYSRRQRAIRNFVASSVLRAGHALENQQATEKGDTTTWIESSVKYNHRW